MAATTTLGSKPLKGASTFLPELRLTTPVSIELAANDSKSPDSSRSQAVTSESGRL
jgi:hypothetical protein